MSTAISSAELAYSLLPGWSQYITHKPWPKQLAFCMLPHREALYGGAAGGGKSDALLMAALMFADIPHYSAIIFRKSLTDLQGSEGLLTRAQEWLYQFPEVRYVPSLHTFIFPSTARLQFGYMGSETAWEGYQGNAYQFIGWDELTQHVEIYYLEMMSRLRKLQCPEHGGRIIEGKRAPLPDDPECRGCQMYAQVSRVPLRIRSTSNPGGRGHHWVKKRFLIHKDKRTQQWASGVADRPFIPASFLDNPSLEWESYGRNLDELDEARRAQLKEGDWDKIATGRYKHEWFRKYVWSGGYYILLDPNTGERTASFHEDKLRIFTICDVACSVRTGVGTEGFYKNREPSWTVISTWGITPNNKLLCLEVIRFQEETPFLFPKLHDVVQRWKPLYVGMDATGPGLPIAQLAASKGIPVKELISTFDKIANSAEAMDHAKRGRIYVPEESTWVDDYLGELTVWTGHPHDTNDQVDITSNAGHEFTLLAGQLDREVMLLSHMTEEPILHANHANVLFENDAGGPPGAWAGY